MSVESNKHKRIREALDKIHLENISPKHQGYVQQSMAICDTLDIHFAALRDSIVLDKERYLKMAADIDSLELTNQQVVTRLREAIFNAFKANGIEIASLPHEIDMRVTSTIMGNKLPI